jgi:hypothetical protein
MEIVPFRTPAAKNEPLQPKGDTKGLTDDLTGPVAGKDFGRP